MKYEIYYQGKKIETIYADGFYTPPEQIGYWFFIGGGDSKKIVAVFSKEYSFVKTK
jgi:hypothetical protein